MESFWKFINQKHVRLTLAFFCFLMAVQGLARIVMQQTEPAMLRGLGEILLWGGYTAVNAGHPYGRTIPRINLAINIGLVLVILSWFGQTV